MYAYFPNYFVIFLFLKYAFFPAVTENEHDSNMLSSWISVLVIMTALIIGFRVCVSLKNKIKGKT